MCSLLQSGLLKGKLLAAWVCTVSYEHRPRDCWGNEISRTCPLRDSTDAVRAGQQYPPAPRAAPSMYELEELNPSVSEATVYKHIQKLIDAGIVRKSHSTTISAGKDIPGSSTPHRGGPDLPRRTQSPRRGGNPPTDLRDHLQQAREDGQVRERPSPGRRVTPTESAPCQYSIIC